MDRASRGAAARVGIGSIASPPPVPCWLTERLAGAPTLMVSPVKVVLLVKVAPLVEVDTEPGKNAGAFTDSVGADNAGTFTDNAGVHVGGPEGGPLRLTAVVVPILEASIGCVLIADG